MARARVIWLPSAAKDLERIVQFIRRDSPSYAASVARRIVGVARELPAFPKLGRVVPEWDVQDIRERLVYSYPLIYRIKEREIRVLGIIHGARILPDEVRDRTR